MADRVADGMREGTRERRVRTPGGVELCVAEFGDPAQPTVILVHGYPDSKEVWLPVARRLADRHHVVLYDVRGCGRSSAPEPLRGGYTLEKLTDDFLTVAEAVCPDRPVHLVGHDWGSVQGWEFVTARRTEGRIASFTSVSGPCLDHFGHWLNKRLTRPTPRRVSQLLGQGAMAWHVFLLQIPALPERAWKGPLGRRWPGLLRRLEKVPADGSYPAPSLPTDAAHGTWLYRDNVRARLSCPRSDAYAHAPVQLVTPTEDAFLSPHLSDDLELWVPRLTRRTLPAGHWVPRTRPDQLTAWISEFVTRNEDGVPAGEPLATGPYADRFGGQLVLVTGAADGAGRATAFSFAEAGARIVAVDRDAEGVARTAELARLIGAPQAWGEAVDVADEQAMEKLAAKVAAECGVVDVLVNSAGNGNGAGGSFLSTTTEDWQKTLHVNLWGVVHSCRLFGRQMAERGQGGRVVNIVDKGGTVDTASAIAGRRSLGPAARSTSEAAVLRLSECLRAELAGRDIGVCVVGPVRLDGDRPERVADAVLRAVVRNQAVVPVAPRVLRVRARLRRRR